MGLVQRRERVPSADADACVGYAACAARAAARDPTRFRTSASNMELNDKCLDHATLISFNNYPAWYSCPHFGCNLSEPAAHWTAMAAACAPPSRRSVQFVISETGAGGIAGEWSHNDTDARWTTKYQTEVIERDVDVALADATISGLTRHFFDFKGDDGAQANCGPCDYEKGVSPPVCAYYNVGGTKCGGFRPAASTTRASSTSGAARRMISWIVRITVVAAKYKAAQRRERGGGRGLNQFLLSTNGLGGVPPSSRAASAFCRTSS